MTKVSSMSKDGRNPFKSRFCCYFRCSLVNFKNFIILFFEVMVYLWLFMVCEIVEEVLFLFGT